MIFALQKIIEMNDSYSHIENNIFYIVENVMGPAEKSVEFELLLNNFNSQLSEHCNCNKICYFPSCNCLYKSRGRNYVKFLQEEQVKYKLHHKTESVPIIECNERCSCSNECGNRIVQNGPMEGLEIMHCDKGLGLYTRCFIPEGTFICEYAGEVITSTQAANRHNINQLYSKMNYIFCLKEHSGESVVKTFVDPSVFGNIGRYMNHSCDPNCHIVPVRCDSAVPKLAIFALVDISPSDELTFHYGSSNICDSGVAETRIKCLCKSESCTGFIPFYNY